MNEWDSVPCKYLLGCKVRLTFSEALCFLVMTLNISFQAFSFSSRVKNFKLSFL